MEPYFWVVYVTTVRELFELGQFERVRSILKERAGRVPLCCFTMNKDRQITCDWLKKFYSMEEFTKRCLECQNEMVKVLGGLNGEASGSLA
jgi:hypothetical protein